MTHHNRPNQLTPRDDPANDFLDQVRPMRPRTYRNEVEDEARFRLAWMFDLRPIIGNLVAMALLIGAVVVYRLDLGIFPDIGRWTPYVQMILAALAGYQLVRASFRSYLAPAIGAIFAGVGLAVAARGDALLALPVELYQWAALLAVIGVGCAALSGRE